MAVGGMGREQGVAPVGPGALRLEGTVQPFLKGRREIEGGMNRLAQAARRQPDCQRVDRLDPHDPIGLGDGHDMVRMGHLQFVLEQFEPAADDPPLAHRKGFFQVVAVDVKEDQGEDSGAVGADHPIRHAAPRLGWRPVGLDRHRKGRDPVRHRVRQARGVAPVDQPARQMPEQIDDPLARHPRQGLGDARADTGQRGNRGKQRKQDLRAHFACEFGAGKLTAVGEGST